MLVRVVTLVILVLLLIMFRYILLQSTFYMKNECLIIHEEHFDNLPPIDMVAFVANKRKQNGIKVKSGRLTEKDLIVVAPDLVTYIHSPSFTDRIHTILGFVPVSTIVFARTYEKGDKLDWHYDQNLTNGRKYTGILHISVPECNTSFFQYRQPCTGIVHTPSPTKGTLYLYPGNKVFHRVTEQKNDCMRLVLVFGFTEMYESTVMKRVIHTLVRFGNNIFDF